MSVTEEDILAASKVIAEHKKQRTEPRFEIIWGDGERDSFDRFLRTGFTGVFWPNHEPREIIRQAWETFAIVCGFLEGAE